MTFITPPECQGQIVEVSYACCGDTIIRRIYDKSDRTTSYQKTVIVDKNDWHWYDSYHPVNGKPPVNDESWVNTDEDELQFLMS